MVVNLIGEVLGDLLRGLAEPVVQRLDRRGACSLTVLVIAVSACVLSTWGEDGSLWRLVPVTTLVAVLVGAFLLLRGRLSSAGQTAQAAPPDPAASAGAAEADAEPAAIAEVGSPERAGSSDEPAETAGSWPSPSTRALTAGVARLPVATGGAAQPFTFHLSFGIAIAAGHLTAHLLLSRALVAYFSAAGSTAWRALVETVASVQMQFCCPIPAILGFGLLLSHGVTTWTATPQTHRRRSPKPIWLALGFFIGLLAYAPIQFVLVLSAGFSR